MITKILTRYRCKYCNIRHSTIIKECYSCGMHSIYWVSQPYYTLVSFAGKWWNPLTWFQTKEEEL